MLSHLRCVNRSTPARRLAVLTEGLERGVLRNRTLRDGQAVTILDVHVSRDLSL